MPVIVLVLLGLLTPTPALASSRQAESDMALAPEVYKARIFAELNFERSVHFVNQVARGGNLDKSAQHWSDHLASTSGPLEHGDWVDRLHNFGVTQPHIGEILADGNWTPEQTVDHWMASPEHHDIILDPGFADMGVGATLADNQVWWVTVDWAGPGS